MQKEQLTCDLCERTYEGEQPEVGLNLCPSCISKHIHYTKPKELEHTQSSSQNDAANIFGNHLGNFTDEFCKSRGFQYRSNIFLKCHEALKDITKDDLVKFSMVINNPMLKTILPLLYLTSPRYEEDYTPTSDSLCEALGTTTEKVKECAHNLSLERDVDMTSLEACLIKFYFLEKQINKILKNALS